MSEGHIGVINIAVQTLILCVKYYSFTQVPVQNTEIKGPGLVLHFLYFAARFVLSARIGHMTTLYFQ